MKKTILSFLLIGSAGLAMAQQQPATSNPDKNKINSNPNLNSTPVTNPNNTYPQSTNVPPTNQPPTNMNTNADSTVVMDPQSPAPTSSMQNSAVVSTTYKLNVPTSIHASFETNYPGVTGNIWQQSGDWYVTRYVENGEIKQVSYREDGKILTATMSPVRKSFVPDEIVSQAIQKYGASLYAIGSSKGADGQDLYNVTVIENGQSKTEWMNGDGSMSDNHFRMADDAMNVNEQSIHMQESEPMSQDSAAIQSEPSDTTTVNDQPEGTGTEPQPSSQPQDQSKDEGSNNANEEGLNNASGINAAPRRS